MLVDTVYSSAPATLAIIFAVALVYESLHLPVKKTTQQFGRQRSVFLSLCSLCTSTFAGRAIDLTVHKTEYIDNALLYTLSQVLLQTTIFLTLLASSNPSPVPYMTIWALTLFVETAVALNLVAKQHSDTTILFSLSVTTTTVLVMLSIGASASWWTDSPTRNQEEQESLLRKSRSHSDTSSASDTASQRLSQPSYDVVSVSDSETKTDFSEDDDDADAEEEAIKATRAQKLQSGGLLSYCASYKILIPYVIPTKNLRLQAYMIIIVLNILIQRALNLLSPYLLGRIIDKLTERREFPVLHVVAYVLVMMLASDMCGLAGLNNALFQRLGAWSRQTLVVTAFDKIMSLSADFHDSKDSGEVIKAVEQAESLSELLNLVVVEVLPAFLDLIIAMYYVNYLLDQYATLIIVAVGVAFCFSTIFASRPVNTSRRVVASTERTESEILYEAVGSWAIVTYFNRKIYEIARLSKVAQAVAVANVKNEDSMILMFAAQEVSERLGLIVILLLATFRIVNGTSTIGTFVTVENYWSIISSPLYNLGYTYRQSASHLIDAERLLQLFETEMKVKDHPDARALVPERGKIDFVDVDFGYESSGSVIHDLSFTIQPGQSVALVGSTGSGKSTITKLLMRFYDINAGKILIDDQDIATATQSSLRDCFGFVPQDSVLFNTTVMENVRYGKLDATDDEVHAACRAACIHDRIMSLPKGYLTRVGERGVKMSGGERQRIAIARVLLKTPWIVVLDEATSAMDSQTESEIQKALKNLTKGRSCIIVAHRLSTIIDADVIFVVDQGRIVEQGTHNELLQSKGRYHQLWEKQVATHGTFVTDANILDELNAS